MSFVCPKGHQSDDNDYCSVCGARMNAQPLAQTGIGGMDPAPAGGLSGFSPSTASAPVGDVCPDCSTPRTPGARFCEVCRYDFVNKASNASFSPTLTAAPVSTPAPAASSGGSLSGYELPPSTPFTPSRPSAPAAATASFSTSSQGGTGANARWKLVATADESLMTEKDPSIQFPVGEPAREFTLDLRENIVGRRPASAASVRPDAPIPDPGVSSRHLRLEARDDGTLWAIELGSSNGTLFRGKPLDAGVATQLGEGDEMTIGMWTRLRVSRA